MAVADNAYGGQKHAGLSLHIWRTDSNAGLRLTGTTVNIFGGRRTGTCMCPEPVVLLIALVLT